VTLNNLLNTSKILVLYVICSAQHVYIRPKITFTIPIFILLCSVTIRLTPIRIRGGISVIFGFTDNIFQTDRMERIKGYPWRIIRMILADDPADHLTDHLTDDI
jgi:hypothetical protein